MEFEYDPKEISRMNDKTHLTHFVNYMFRTDKAQKNTNADTLNNIYAVWNQEQVKIRSGSVKNLSERIKLRDELLQLTNQHPATSFFNDFIYLDGIDAIDEDELVGVSLQAAFQMRGFFKNEVTDARLYVDQSADREFQFCTHIFATALHADQGGQGNRIRELHVHTLYLVEWTLY